MLKFVIRSVLQEPLMIGQWYWVCHCISNVPSHFHADYELLTPQSWSSDFEIFMLKFMIRSVLKEPLMVGQWYWVCSCINNVPSHFQGDY